MTPRRLILLCNPTSIKADGKPLGGKPSFTPADAAMAFCDATSDELAAFAYRWGGWDSEYERCLLFLWRTWDRSRQQKWVGMPEDEEEALRLCALVLREERAPQTVGSRCAWMGVKERTWHRRLRPAFIVLSQSFEMLCNDAERKAWRRLRQAA
jgi:hypothetical protein